MQIGFSLNEWLAVATAFTAVLAFAWRLRRKRDPRKPWWAAWGADFFVVFALVFGCRVALADWMYVPSGSMEPTVRVGDVLLIDHLAYGPRLPFTNTALPMGRPRRGDVLVFRNPRNVDEHWVKRVVGLPGDTVRFDHDRVSVNGAPWTDAPLEPGTRADDRGQVLSRERLDGRTHAIKISPWLEGRMPMSIPAPDCANDGESRWHCTVPAGRLLVLGDNRDNSADSRVFGFLPEQEIYGRVDRILFNYRERGRWWLPV